MSESLTLALDGSTDVCSTALLDGCEADGRGALHVVAARAERSGRGQARVLLNMVDDMLKETGATPSDLGSVVVGTGPGTFTGVRIAVATARGIALALAVPVFGVSSLAALAAAVLEQASAKQRAEWSTVVPVIDARRQQVFYSTYEAETVSAEGDLAIWKQVGPVSVCDRGGLPGLAVDAAGCATAVVGQDEELVGALPDGAVFLQRDIQAEYLCLGQQRLRGHETRRASNTRGADEDAQSPDGSPETVKPIYVRAPDADLHIKKMKDPWAAGDVRR